jgi:hypothetical protein
VKPQAIGAVFSLDEEKEETALRVCAWGRRLVLEVEGETSVTLTLSQAQALRALLTIGIDLVEDDVRAFEEAEDDDDAPDEDDADGASPVRDDPARD